MTQKYYTPKIEEFYEGFEYEIKYGDLFYKKNSIIKSEENPSIESIKMFLEKEGIIRVKYLDSEDIESLGFDNYIPPMEYNHSWSFKGSKEPKLYAWFNDKVPVVRIYSNFPSIQFHGEVKNKSELKKIMQMIGII